MPENFNPFVPNASYPYPLKTSGNLVFRGLRKSALDTNGLKEHILVHDVLLFLHKTYQRFSSLNIQSRVNSS